MRSVLKKLKNKAGESLVESLAAILIFAMASVVMYSMVTTSADLNRTVKEMDKKNQDHLSAVEEGAAEYKSGEAQIVFSLQKSDGSTCEIAEVQVDIYGGQDDSLYTYFLQTD